MKNSVGCPVGAGVGVGVGRGKVAERVWVAILPQVSGGAKKERQK